MKDLYFVENAQTSEAQRRETAKRRLVVFKQILAEVLAAVALMRVPHRRTGVFLLFPPALIAPALV
jgi:hypothetical protein